MVKELFSEKAKAVLVFLQEHMGEEYTAKEIAEEIGLTSPQVNGVITSSLQARGYTIRELREDSADKVIILTDAGIAVDPNTTIDITE